MGVSSVLFHLFATLYIVCGAETKWQKLKGGKGGNGFICSVQEEGHGKRTGARRGEGASRVVHGDFPGGKEG